MFETKKHSETDLSEKPQNLAKDYVRTSDQQKLELIDLVINEKYSMKLASEIVGVKLSTVKYIIKAYKTDKQYFMDKLKPKRVKFQKEKRKESTKNKAISDEENSEKNSQKISLSPSEVDTSKTASEQTISFPQFIFGNAFAYQDYFQQITQWNNFIQFNNLWFNGQYRI